MTLEISSSIRDNQGRGKVGDFLKDKIQVSSKLSIEAVLIWLITALGYVKRGS